jgi:hypothetical protein
MYNFADSTVTASAFTAGANTGLTLVASTAGLTTTAALVIYYDDQLQSTAITISNFPASQAISGTVTANAGDNFPSLIASGILSFQDNDGFNISSLPAISGTVTVGGGFISLTTGTSRIGVVTVGNSVTIGAGTVTIGAGTAQIGSVTASISGTVPISISSVTVGNSVTIGSLPAISGTVTANTFAVQGTAVTTSNFTSTTASTVLAGYNATREVLTIFNEGAGNLHISPGATCTTIAYQVRLSAGDYFEVPSHQTTITHSAVFATAGTARICQLS